METGTPVRRRRRVRLMGLTEAAAALKVSTRRVHRLRELGAMPEPVAQLKCGPVWLAVEIEEYARTRRRVPGPVPKLKDTPEGEK